MVTRFTRKDVAELAGVSTATVSYVFNKKRYVSQELTNKVLFAAKRLNYYPDMIASSLTTKKTHNIGVLVNDLSNPLQNAVISGIQRAAIKKGYFVNICAGESNFDVYIDNFISRHLDGVYIAVQATEIQREDILKLLDYNIKLVLNKTMNINDPRVNQIHLDLTAGMMMIIEYLAKKGHKDIAYLSCYDESVLSDERLPAFKAAMRKYLGCNDPVIIYGKVPYESTIESGKILVEQLLDTGKTCSALVCSNDLMAFGAMKVLHDSGYRIPEDISVVGIDNIELCKSSIPSLTTLDQKSEELGMAIFDLLYNDIVNGEIAQKCIWPQLVIRDSTAPYGKG